MSARIVVRHHRDRDWHAHIDGAGAGQAWGVALAALDYAAHTVTDGPRPTFWLDVDAVTPYRHLCEWLGVRVEVRAGAARAAAR